MKKEMQLQQLRLRLPDITDGTQDHLLRGLLEDAGSLIRALTWRQSVPPELWNAQVRLAVVMYNRLGMEGESSHQEGDVSRSVDGIPDGLRREILAYRLAST